MAGAAEGMIFKGVCGSLYGCDTEVDRHPYHRNCNCALHRSRSSGKPQKSGHNCPHGLPRHKTVSYPLRKSWSEGCLALSAAAAAAASSPSSSSPSSPASSAQSSPAPAAGKALLGRHRRLSSLDEVEEEDRGVFFEV